MALDAKVASEGGEAFPGPALRRRGHRGLLLTGSCGWGAEGQRQHVWVKP